MVVLKNIQYDGKQYKVGPRFATKDVRSRNFTKTNVDPDAVNQLVIYAQDYFRIYHPIMHTFEFMRRRIESSSIYNWFTNEVREHMPGQLKDQVDKWDIKEYRMDGDVIGNDIDLKIDVIDHRTGEMRPAVLEDSKARELITKYVYEIQRYKSDTIDSRLVATALSPWCRELALSEQSCDLLYDRIAKNLTYYKVKEQPLVGFMMFRYMKTGAVRSIGQRYKRNPIPLIDWADFLSPVIDFVTDSSQFGPKESGIEDPEEIAIFIPRSVAKTPVLGKRTKIHQLRHALYYAAFVELLNPDSLIYTDIPDRESRVYDTLEDLIKRDRIYEERMPNFLTEEYFRDKDIDFFREHHVLEDPHQRSLLATALYLKENMEGHSYREALTHSTAGHIGFLAAPWLLGAPFFPLYWAPIVNCATAALGHGNIPYYWNVRRKLKQCANPHEELFTLATLGNNEIEKEKKLEGALSLVPYARNDG